MSLLDLSWRNLKRSFRLYAIYFISMLIGVIIHFTFSALMFNADILAAIEQKRNYQLGLSITSVVIFLFIIFFILYANSFFMKQRKKEFGMYLLYGMSERQITSMVFLETCFLSVISVVSGIVIGGLLSKFFGMLLMNLMQYDDVISFSFPIEAVGSTILLFVILIGIISAQSYLSVRRVQLVELFHAVAKRDKPLTFSMWLALLAILLLGVAYFLISQKGDSVFWSDYLLASMIAVTVGIIGGTYLFFRQFLGWVLEKISRRKTYMEGNKVLWISALRFSIRGNTLNLTFISLFSTIVIFLVGFVSINYTVQIFSAGKEFPNHIAFASQDPNTQKQIEQLIEEDHHITGHERIEGLSVKPVTDSRSANGDNFQENYLLFSASHYNNVVRMRSDKEQVNVQNQEAIALIQGARPLLFTANNQPKLTVNLKGETTFHLIEKKDYALLSKATNANGDVGLKPSVVIISDQAFERLKQGNALASFDIYQIEDAKHSIALSHKVHDIVSRTPGTYYAAFIDLYSIDVETSSLLLFSAAFLAAIAVFAMGSIIYFKQLREATEEQRHYAILRKLGVDDHELKWVIRKQLLFVFLPPLLLGILHSWFITYYPTLHEVRNFPQLTSIISAIFILYVVIYFLFYVSSTSVYYKIVSQKNAMS
ncbi:ABC transporter permease protein YxdM [Paenibacillus allorhizoplanae]|uniref:ABC transporter permease protein YxdM n=1 Tax=Paenibacillus allorhizoplanae TaxID=2905648 RepID=A0ABM9CZE4_9BACL|nr:ABC transporter permease [Paenibacillus allorhizoplanae]CAH1228710.1 ABC transporter permease protein YxdM [Paenibacillus allorhizoplanae]